MTCGFLIRLVFCKKKKICGLLVLKKSKRRVHPLLKKSWIRPCNSIYVACGHLLKSSERWLKLLPYRIIGIIFIAFVDLKVARYWMLHPVTPGWNILKSGKTPPSTIRSVLRQFEYKMRSFKTNCYLPEWATFEKISETGAQQMRYMKINSLGFIQLLGKVIPAN